MKLKLSNAFFARLFGSITFAYVAVGSILPKIIKIDKANVGFMMAIVTYFLKPPRDVQDSHEGASDATEGE